MAGGYILNPLGHLVPADMAQPDPSIVAAAQPGPDMRTANLDSAISGALAQGAPPTAIPGATFGPISSGGPAPVAQPTGDAGKIQTALGNGSFGGANPLDAGKPLDLRLVKARVDAMNAPAQQQGSPGGAPIFASPQASRPASALPPGAYVVREGRFIPHSRTTQEATPVSEETKLNLERAYTDQMSAATAAGEHEAQAADERAGQLGTTATNLGIMNAVSQDREAERQAQSQAALDKYGQMQRAIESDQVDPKRLFRNQSDAEKFQSRVYMAMGALGASISGGRNNYQDAFFKAIDDDVAAQNKALEGKRQNLADQRGMVAMMREHFGDERQAENAAKMAYLDMAKLKADQMAATASSQAARDKAAAFSADVKAKWNEYQAGLERSGVVHTNEAYQQAGVYGTGKPAKQSDVESYAKFTAEQGIPAARAALKDAYAAIDPNASDIPGFGVVGSRMPNMLTSAAGVKNRQVIKNLIVPYAHAMGMKSPEAQAELEQNLLQNSSPAALKQTLQMMQHNLDEKERNVMASAPDEVRAEYDRRAAGFSSSTTPATAVRPAGE